MSFSTSCPLLGGLSVETFLKEYWQKKPLLVRQAFPNFIPFVQGEDLLKLAMREEMESRLVQCRHGKWSLKHGPFSASMLKQLPETDWTILVQNVNHVVPEAEALLQQFNFIPFSRLDDLMISYAPKGGTVGPHFDSYDVFLIQAGAPKRWQISQKTDTTLVPDAPLRLLENFTFEEEWVVEPGDMLYLPPQYAHYGVAMEAGLTYSVGFRTPTTQELATAFLVYLQDRIELEGRYADPDLIASSRPAEMATPMLDQVATMLNQIQWTPKTIADFLGCYLTEPKAHVFFDAPDEDSDEMPPFCERGVRLDPKSQLLYQGEHFFLNGESYQIVGESVAWLQRFADARSLAPGAYPEPVLALFLDWFECGFIHLLD